MCIFHLILITTPWGGYHHDLQLDICQNWSITRLSKFPKVREPARNITEIETQPLHIMTSVNSVLVFHSNGTWLYALWLFARYKRFRRQKSAQFNSCPCQGPAKSLTASNKYELRICNVSDTVPSTSRKCPSLLFFTSSFQDFFFRMLGLIKLV